MSTGYVHCAHTYCFAVIIGREGDLCDDCKACDENKDVQSCDGCDNDSDVQIVRGKRADDETSHYRSEG